MPNKEAPHQTVVLIKYEIHERNPDGSCQARCVEKDSKLVVISGKDLDDVKSKTEHFLEVIENAKKETETR